MVHRVSKAANDAIDRSTAELMKRIGHLENLERDQAEEDQRVKDSDDAQISRVREDDLTASSIGELILSARADKRIGERYRVRTSDDPGCHLMYILLLEDPDGIPAVLLDFEPLVASEYLEELEDGSPTWRTEKSDSTVMWTQGESAAEIGAELESGLRRRNQPMHGFSFRFTLDQFAASIEVERNARRAEAADQRRLKGSLELLLNPEWVLTSYGLEGVQNSCSFETTIVGSTIAGLWMSSHIRITAEPEGDDLTGWCMARSWLKDREGCELLFRDQEPTLRHRQ